MSAGLHVHEFLRYSFKGIHDMECHIALSVVHNVLDILNNSYISFFV